VVFQGGDLEDCTAIEPIRFLSSIGEWPAFLSDLLHSIRPDCLMLFGQGREYHKVAMERARAMDIPVIVLEEGYFRPGYVTMELGGVNGYSTTLDRFVWRGSKSLAPAISQMHFQKMAWQASKHYVAIKKHERQFPYYTHHRSTDLSSYASYWVRSWYRKALIRRRDLKFQGRLLASKTPYYFVPLQLEGDSQIKQHSPFECIADFVIEVMASFATRASATSHLVFRQHPHARGGPGHSELIRNLAATYGISERVHHLVEGDTPVLAEHSRGTVLINSTVGLQALERGSPLIVLGDAPYKQPAFTFMGALDDFWRDCQRPEPQLTADFLTQVKNLTQVPASVYALKSEPLSWGHAPASTK